MMHRSRIRLAWAAALAVVLAMGTFAVPTNAFAGASERLQDELHRAFDDLPRALVPSGILLDRVIPLAHPERFNGGELAPAATPAALREILHELRRASDAAPSGPTPDELRARGRTLADGGVIPIAVVDARAERLLAPPSSAATETIRIFAAAPLVSESRRGASIAFAVEQNLWTAMGRPLPSRLELDLDDGLGLRAVRFGEAVNPEWMSIGRRTLALRATWDDGDVRLARFVFDVVRMVTPAPNDTLFVTASVPYGGSVGSGRAYLYLAEGHVSVENPIVVIEGFDLDDSMSWERLYELLNQENLIEDARAEGFDAVVLDFDSATEPIQRNAFVVAELLQQVGAMIGPSQDIFLVGASMGGLCSRYALTWLESQSIDARVRTFLSFDTPHGGANVPLGIQYWLDFFSEQSSDAAYLLSRLDTPAARQMLVAHHTSPPGSTGAPDPLRASFLADLSSLGDWPESPRRIAVANGSGIQQGQGFAPAAQIIAYQYRSFLVDIDGDVWAVPNQNPATIFHGRIDFIFLPADEQFVTVSGTPPWDNAPGGTRDSMFQMDTTAAPYGDIVALHPAHCFVPTVSALALPTSDLFFNVAGTPDVVSLTPFSAIRWASGNEEHVFIAPDTKAWIMSEIEAAPTGAPSSWEVQPPLLLSVPPAFPNPFTDQVALSFSLGVDAPVTLDIFDAAGRRTDRLLNAAMLSAGPHVVHWSPKAGGVYFYRVDAAGESRTGRLTALLR